MLLTGLGRACDFRQKRFQFSTEIIEGRHTRCDATQQIFIVDRIDSPKNLIACFLLCPFQIGKTRSLIHMMKFFAWVFDFLDQDLFRHITQHI